MSKTFSEPSEPILEFQKKSNDTIIPQRFSVAPMIDLTDKHCRYFHRLLSQHAFLYTEMITTGAILHGDAQRYLTMNTEEQPVALQLGGSSPEALGNACNIAKDFQYNEINLNVGCPSDRVQSGKFGACLMREPDLVADCVSAMQENSNVDVTVKCRTGIDNDDSITFLLNFIQTIQATGCKTFIIHARKAWLNGLSPKENREIPPLHYERAYYIKNQFPELNIVVNGGIKTIDECQAHLNYVDGVMLGREAYSNPWLLREVDHALYTNDNNSIQTKYQAIEAMLPYIEEQMQQGSRLHHITRHMLGLFNGQKGAKQFRRYLSENGHSASAGPEVLLTASRLVEAN